MSRIPPLGLGTFRLQGERARNSVKMALEVGYRLIDTAQIYGNEDAVGQAVVESGVKREELFLTTKIWIDNLDKVKFIPSLKESLHKLQTDYVDLTLIHWPSPGKYGAIASLYGDFGASQGARIDPVNRRFKFSCCVVGRSNCDRGCV